MRIPDRLQRWLPIRSLDRYLIRQLLLAYAVCASAILGLFVVLEGLSRLDNFLKQDVNLLVVVFRYFLATIPVYFCQYLGPVFTLLSAMFAITLLNKGNEIAPMKAAGISVQRILAPFFLMAGVFALLMMVTQELVIPNLKDNIRIATSYGKGKDMIHPDPVMDSNNQKIAVDEYLPHKKRGTTVEILRLQPGRTDSLIRCRELVYREDHWVMIDGAAQKWDEQSRYRRVEEADPEDPFTRFFDEEVLVTDMRPEDLESSDRDIPYLSWSELRNQYRRRDHLKHLEVKLHQRFAFPLSNFILLLLGLPFVLRGENKSILVGVAVAIGISGLYLLGTTICADLGNKGQLPPIFAAWLPILFFGALGFTLFDNIES